MPRLLQFLLERLDEDEAAVLAEVQARAGTPREPGQVLTGTTIRWNPARILAECEAKRRMIMTVASCEQSHLLRLLALPYAWHRDYDQSWRPQVSPPDRFDDVKDRFTG